MTSDPQETMECARFYFSYIQDCGWGVMVCHGEAIADSWESAMRKGLAGQGTAYILAYDWPNSILACFEMRDDESYSAWREVDFSSQWVHPKSNDQALAALRQKLYNTWMGVSEPLPSKVDCPEMPWWRKLFWGGRHEA